MGQIIHRSLSAFCAIYLFISLVLGFETSLIPFSIIILLSSNIYMLIISRHNFLFLFVAFVLLYSNYSIVYVNFINYLEGDTFTRIIEDWVTVRSLNVLVFFNCILLLVVKWHKITPIRSNSFFVDKERSNIIIVFLLSIALLLIYKYGYTIPTTPGARGSTSAMYEYSIILFILYFYYCGNRRKMVYWGLFLVSLYCIQGFIYGGRIEGIQLLLCSYFMLYMTKIKKYKVITLFLIMFLLMSTIGAVRGELMSGNFDMDSILLRILERGFALDTSYSAYFASETFIYVQAQMSDGAIWDLFISFLKSLVVGGDRDSSLSTISMKYVLHYGGGILPFYLYFYIGVFGVILSSLLVGTYLNFFTKIKECSNGLSKCLFIMIVCTTFRWYLYSPMMLLRGALFMVIAYYGLFMFHNLSKSYLRKTIKIA